MGVVEIQNKGAARRRQVRSDGGVMLVEFCL